MNLVNKFKNIIQKLTQNLHYTPKTESVYSIQSAVVIDIETSGLGHNAEIIQIGAIFIKNGQIVDEYEQLITPQKITSTITAVSNFTPQDFINKPTIEYILPGFIERIKGLTIIGHNVTFDINQINNVAKKINIQGIKPTNVIDTMTMARSTFPTATTYSLQAIMYILGIDEEEQHTALSDAHHTLQCFNKLQNISSPRKLTVQEQETQKLAQKIAHQKRKKIQQQKYLNSHNTEPLNTQPQGIPVINTIECGVDINGEEKHQQLLQKYGYDAWLWVRVKQGTIPKGQYKGYPTYWVSLDGVEIGHITKFQMERHIGQIPYDGAAMIAHIPNSKTHKERGIYHLRLQMPYEHETKELTRIIEMQEKTKPIKIKANKKEIRRHKTEEKNIFINNKPHKKVLTGTNWQLYTLDQTTGLVDFSEIEDDTHFWATATTEGNNIVIRFSGKIIGTISKPSNITNIETASVVEAVIKNQTDGKEILVYLPTD